MNRAILNELTGEWADKLVSLGAQREDVEGAMLYLRNVCIASEAEARSDAQFLLELKRVGSAGRMGAMLGKSGQSVRQRKTRIYKKQRGVAVEVAG